MTVTTTTDNRTQVTGNGVWDDITVNWPMFQNSDGSHAIQVIKTTIATSATETLTETTDYTVTLDGTSPNTGIVTIVAGAPSSAYRYTVLPNIPKKQEVDLQNAVQIDMPTIEAALDKLTLLIQAQDELLSRAVILAQDTTITDITLPSFGASDANKVVTINGTGTGMTTISVDELVSVSSFDISTLTAETVVDGAADYLAMYDASAGAMRKVLANTIQTDITALTEDTSPDESADFLLMYDTSAAANKKVKPNNIDTNISGKTELTAGQIDTTSDMLVVYDASAGTNKKVAPSNLGISAGFSGQIKDIQVTTLTTSTTVSAAAAFTWYDISGLSVSITPGSVNDRILIGGQFTICPDADGDIFYWRIVRSDGKVLAPGTEFGRFGVRGTFKWGGGSYQTSAYTFPIMELDDVAGTTSALTYKVQVAVYAGDTGTLYINRSDTDTDNTTTSRYVSQIFAMRIN